MSQKSQVQAGLLDLLVNQQDEDILNEIVSNHLEEDQYCTVRTGGIIDIWQEVNGTEVHVAAFKIQNIQIEPLTGEEE